MRLRAAPGEAALGLTLVAVGAFWIFQANRLPLWDGPVPSTGFLPLIYGILLVGLATAALLLEAKSTADTPEDAGAIRKPLMVVAVLAAAIAGIEPAGFFGAVLVALLCLFRLVERLPLLGSVLASLGTALALTLIFRTWLGVPLPKGPWGF